jgi:LacI family transcriptional regulator
MAELLKDKSIHRHIYLDIERKITTGEIRYLEQLPSLSRLCDLYGVSEAPIRRALDELSRNGMIEKRRGRGKGTFVIKRMVPTTIRVLMMLGEHGPRSRIELYHETFELVGGIREAAQERGYRLQIVSPDSFDSLPPAGSSTGYLVIATEVLDFQAGVALAESHGSPVVSVNTPVEGGLTSVVRADMQYGTYAAVSYLAQLGHRSIAYVGGFSVTWHAPRLDGYRQALEEYGLPFRPELVRTTNGIDVDGEANALGELLSVESPPTAIFASSDYRALHLMDACRQRNLLVPEQISICGYDDISEAADVYPSLTSVHHPCRDLGRIAVDRLYDLIHKKAKPSDVVVRPHLVVRESCAPPAS